MVKGIMGVIFSLCALAGVLLLYAFVYEPVMNWSTLSPLERGTTVTVIGAALFSLIVALVGFTDAFGEHKKQPEEIPDFSKEPPSLGDAKPGRARRVQWLCL